MCEELVEGCGASSGLYVPMGNGVPLGVTGWSGGSDNRGPQRELYIRKLVSPNRSSYLSSISMLTSLVFMNPSPDGSILVILEYTSTNRVNS